MTVEKPIPRGLCQCGCGQPTHRAKRANPNTGIQAGEFVSYLTGHHRRNYDHYDVRDCGYKTPCWVYKRQKNQYGYGRLKIYGSKKVVPAHRWYYERAKGPIPEGAFMDHLCCNPPCVNPSHLQAVSPKENVRRGPVGTVGYSRAHAIRIARLTTSLRLDDADMLGVSNSSVQGVLYKPTWLPQDAVPR